MAGINHYPTWTKILNQFTQVRSLRIFLLYLNHISESHFFQLQGGSGLVQGVMFSNIQVSEVETPIMIDQFYCDGSKCQNKTSAVAVSGISYQNIRGTYTLKPVHFACSDSLPCTDVTLNTINLTPIQEKNHLYEPFCWQTYGELQTTTTPPINCLQIGKPSNNHVQNSNGSCWTQPGVSKNCLRSCHNFQTIIC